MGSLLTIPSDVIETETETAITAIESGRETDIATMIDTVKMTHTVLLGGTDREIGEGPGIGMV